MRPTRPIRSSTTGRSCARRWSRSSRAPRGRPTLWIHGTEDPLAPIEQAEAAFERLAGDDFRRRIYEGAAHEVFNETNREEVLDDVCEFIAATLQG